MTEPNQQLLISVLDELAESPAPPSGLDAGRAIRDGQRLRRRHRLAAAGVALAVTAALAGGIALVSQHRTAPDPATPAPTSHWPGSATPHDPLTAPATFGWLPPGLTADGYWGYDAALGHYGHDVSPVATVALGAKPSTGSSGRPMLSLYVYPAGQVPVVFPKGTKFRVPAGQQPPKSHVLPAPSVDGRQAYWYSSSATDPLDRGQPMLRWQTAAGPWAELTAVGFPNQGLAQTLLRTAAGIKVGDRLVPLPYYIAGWPTPTSVRFAGMSLDTVQQTDPQSWQAQATFSIWGYQVDLAIGHGNGAPNDWEGLPDPNEPIVCRTSQGVTVCLHHSGRDKPPASLTAAGGLTGLLREITVLGPDQQNWTTNVLR
jgi:hypothetical protein